MYKTKVVDEKQRAIILLREVISRIEANKFVSVSRTLEVFTDSRKSEERLKIHVEGMDCEVTSGVYVEPEAKDA